MHEALDLARGDHPARRHHDVRRQPARHLACERRSGEEGEPLGVERRHRLLEHRRHELQRPLLDTLRGDDEDRLAADPGGRRRRHATEMARRRDEDDDVPAPRHLRGIRRCPDGLGQRDVREVDRVRVPRGDLLRHLGLVRPHRHDMLEPRQVAGERGTPCAGPDDREPCHGPTLPRAARARTPRARCRS